MNTEPTTSTAIDLTELIALRPDVSAMRLRLIDGDPIEDDEYRELCDRCDIAARAFTAAIVAAFTSEPMTDREANDTSDALTLTADRISGHGELTLMWDEENADRIAAAITIRLLESARSEGAPAAELQELFEVIADDLDDDGRASVVAWLETSGAS